MAYGHIGDSLGSPFLANRGDSRGAQEYYRKAIAIAEAMLVSDSSDSQAGIDLGIALMRLGTVLDRPAEMKESLTTLNKAAAVLEPLLTKGTANVPYSKQLALLYDYQGRRQLQLGDIEGAQRNYHRSLNVSTRLEQIAPDDLSIQRRELAVNFGMAAVLAAKDDREAALAVAGEFEGRAIQFAIRFKGTDLSYNARAPQWHGLVYENLASIPARATGRLPTGVKQDSVTKGRFRNGQPRVPQSSVFTRLK